MGMISTAQVIHVLYACVTKELQRKGEETGANGCSRILCSSLPHKHGTGNIASSCNLSVNERTCEIFSYALASFLHVCQSSHGTRITQKNVSRDDHVNKDHSGYR